MLNSQIIQLRISEVRSRLNEIAGFEGDIFTDEIRTENDGLRTEFRDLETRYQSALIGEDDDRINAPAVPVAGLSVADRERLELRGRVSIGSYIAAALSGRNVQGAEAELQQLAGVAGIPLEAFDTQAVLETRAAEDRAITPAPGTVGINLDPIRPAVFAPSIAEKLMIDMPSVDSGAFASATISQSVTADAIAESADAPQTAGSITVSTTTPHRIAASLALTIEDIAAVGQANFEGILRDNVSLALSSELDNQLISGDDTNDDLIGIFERLTNAPAPAAQVETWARFAAIQSGGIDGLWATMLSHIAMVVGPETYRLAAATLRGADSAETSAAYLMRMGAGDSAFFTNSRMPAKASHIQQGILCRKGRPDTRTAVAPHWGSVGIDDIYSGATKGQRFFTLSVLVGDVILVQPSAYAQVAFRVSS